MRCMLARDLYRDVSCAQNSGHKLTETKAVLRTNHVLALSGFVREVELLAGRAARQSDGEQVVSRNDVAAGEFEEPRLVRSRCE